MITGSVAWETALNAAKTRPLYVFTIPGLSISLCSFDPTLITGGSSLLNIMNVPRGTSQKIDELTGHSSMPSLEITAIDPGGTLKTLAANTVAIGQIARLKMGFPGLDLADFVTIETFKISKIGRTDSGLMMIDCGSLMLGLVSDIFINGGPAAWTTGQATNPFPNAPPAVLDNGVPISNDNPRYLSGNPMDIVLAVVQNELGIGQSTAPVLVPDIGSGSGTGTAGYAINPLWTMYNVTVSSTLITANDYIDIDSILTLRDGQFSGDRMEFTETSSQNGKTWLEDKILQPLGLYWITRSDGKLSLQSIKYPIPTGTITPVSWTNRNGPSTGFLDYMTIADGPSRVYFGLDVATTSNLVLRSLSKSDYTTFSTHTIPTAMKGIYTILPIDEDEVYLGTYHGGSALIWRFKHSTNAFTNLSYPVPNLDAISVIHQMSNDADLLIVGNMSQAAAGSEARLYSYRISTTTWTHIGGFSAGGWGGAGGGDCRIESVSESPGGGLTVFFGYGANAGAQVWRSDTAFGGWIQIGGDTIGSSWATGTKSVGRSIWKSGKLYAGIGGASSGDAEVWRMVGSTWSKIGGDGVGGSWSGMLYAVYIASKNNTLIFGLVGSSNGDSEVWMYNIVSEAWTQIGGDGLDGSWSTLNRVTAVHIDREHILWASPGDGTANTPQFWSTSGPFGSRNPPIIPPDILSIDDSQIIGIPTTDRWPIINMIEATIPSKATGSAGGTSSDTIKFTFVQQTSVDSYKGVFPQPVTADGLRLGLGGYGKLFLLANRMFSRHAFATPEYTIRCYLKEFVLELHEFFLFTHPNVLDLKTGLMGVTNILVEITDRDLAHDAGYVTFKAIDTRFIAIPNGQFVVSDATDHVPTWVDATRTQRRTYLFVSDSNGKMTDHYDGNQIN